MNTEQRMLEFEIRLGLELSLVTQRIDMTNGVKCITANPKTEEGKPMKYQLKAFFNPDSRVAVHVFGTVQDGSWQNAAKIWTTLDGDWDWTSGVSDHTGLVVENTLLTFINTMARASQDADSTAQEGGQA